MITKDYSTYLDKTDKRLEYIFDRLLHLTDTYHPCNFNILEILFTNPASTIPMVKTILKRIYASDRKVYVSDKSYFSKNIHLRLNDLAELHSYIDMNVVSTNQAFDLDDFEQNYPWNINAVFAKNPNAPCYLDGEFFTSNPNISDRELPMLTSEQQYQVLKEKNKITFEGVEYLAEQQLFKDELFSSENPRMRFSHICDHIVDSILTEKTFDKYKKMFGNIHSEQSLYESAVPMQYYMPEILTAHNWPPGLTQIIFGDMLSNPVNTLENILCLPREMQHWEFIALNPNVDIRRLYDQKMVTLNNCLLNPALPVEMIDIAFAETVKNYDHNDLNTNRLLQIMLLNHFGYSMYKYNEDLQQNKFAPSLSLNTPDKLQKKISSLPDELQEKIFGYCSSAFHQDHIKHNHNLRKKHVMPRRYTISVTPLKPAGFVPKYISPYSPMRDVTDDHPLSYIVPRDTPLHLVPGVRVENNGDFIRLTPDHNVIRKLPFDPTLYIEEEKIQHDEIPTFPNVVIRQINKLTEEELDGIPEITFDNDIINNPNRPRRIESPVIEEIIERAERDERKERADRTERQKMFERTEIQNMLERSKTEKIQNIIEKIEKIEEIEKIEKIEEIKEIIQKAKRLVSQADDISYDILPPPDLIMRSYADTNKIIRTIDQPTDDIMVEIYKPLISK